MKQRMPIEMLDESYSHAESSFVCMSNNCKKSSDSNVNFRLKTVSVLKIYLTIKNYLSIKKGTFRLLQFQDNRLNTNLSSKLVSIRTNDLIWALSQAKVLQKLC